MSDWKEFETQAEAIREEIGTLCTEMDTRIREKNYTSFPAKVEDIQRELDRKDFYIVVCGEVKKGKSSLLNAIIGQSILPVDVNVATSQVFCISNAQTESFALVFEDGHREPITRDQLARYGSQQAANLMGEPLFAGRVLRWIEVNVPLQFLPEGIHLIDTPGLGATYAAHSDITRRFVGIADAIVFVLDSQHPVTTEDEKILRQIFDITQDVLFVQTKIDVSGSQWETMQKDHEANLNRLFGSILKKEIPVYPISSLMLMESVNADGKIDDFNYEESHFQAFREALLRELYKVSGWNCSAMVLSGLNQHYWTILNWLKEQSSLLTSNSNQEKKEILERKKQLETEFTQKWVQPGDEKRRIQKKVRDILEDFENGVRAICVQGGALHTRFQNQIMAEDQTFQSLKNLQAELGTQVLAAVDTEWRSCYSRMISRFSAEIGKIQAKGDYMIPQDSASGIMINTRSMGEMLIKAGLHIGHSAMGGTTLGVVGGAIAGGTLGALAIMTGGATLALIPVMMGGGAELGGILGSVIGSCYGMATCKSSQIKEMQNQTVVYLNQILSQVSKSFLMGNPELGTSVGLLIQVRREMEDKILEAIEDRIKSEQDLLTRELATIKQQFDLKGQELENNKKEIAEQVQVWQDFYPRITHVAEMLKQIAAML